MIYWICQGNLHKIKKGYIWLCESDVSLMRCIWNQLLLKSDAFAILGVKELQLRIVVI